MLITSSFKSSFLLSNINAAPPGWLLKMWERCKTAVRCFNTDVGWKSDGCLAWLSKPLYLQAKQEIKHTGNYENLSTDKPQITSAFWEVTFVWLQQSVLQVTRLLLASSQRTHQSVTFVWGGHWQEAKWSDRSGQKSNHAHEHDTDILISTYLWFAGMYNVNVLFYWVGCVFTANVGRLVLSWQCEQNIQIVIGFFFGHKSIFPINISSQPTYNYLMVQ